MDRVSRTTIAAGIAITVLLGVAAGVGMYTFVYAKGYSYLTNDPAACANCHVMGDHFDGWQKSPHHAVAACNDCHTPHESLVGKYWVKATNGFWHSYAFTTGRYPQPLRITGRNRRVTEGACRSCHADMVHAIDASGGDDGFSCVRCHEDVGHPH